MRLLLLARVTVTLCEPAGRGDNVYRATTDAEGRFRIQGVEDASYVALYRAAGFWMSPFVFNPRALPAFPVGANSGPVHLEARMHRVPQISGRVLDPEVKDGPKVVLKWARVSPTDEQRTWALIGMAQALVPARTS